MRNLTEQEPDGFSEYINKIAEPLYTRDYILKMLDQIKKEIYKEACFDEGRFIVSEYNCESIINKHIFKLKGDSK